MELEALTPESWLPILTKRMDERAPRITKLRSRTDGTAPVPELNAKNSVQWTKFQQKSRTLLGLLACESTAERMQPNGFVIGKAKADDADKDKLAEYQEVARRIWRDNRMDVQIADAILDMRITSVAYLLTGKDTFSGHAVITAEKPEFMYASVDPQQPWRARAAIKVWRDLDLGLDLAMVWTPGFRQKFSRPMESDEGVKFATVSEGWTAVSPAEPSSERVPVYILENKGGVGDFEVHIDLLDRIQHGILHRLVISAMQAFRQRAFKGNLPKVDAQGKEIDWATELEAAAGAAWNLPEGVDIWESQPADIRQLLEASKDDIREFAAVTKTPLTILMPDSANQSAEGATAAREGQIFKAKEGMNRITAPISVVLAEALRIEIPAFEENVEILWAPPQLATDGERSNAAIQLKAVGVPFRTIMADTLGYSQDKIDAMELELAQEQLALATMNTAVEGEESRVMPPEETASRINSYAALRRTGVTPEDAASASGLPNMEVIPGLMPVTLKSNEE